MTDPKALIAEGRKWVQITHEEYEAGNPDVDIEHNAAAGHITRLADALEALSEQREPVAVVTFHARNQDEGWNLEGVDPLRESELNGFEFGEGGSYGPVEEDDPDE
jgi:hypothetical protein